MRGEHRAWFVGVLFVLRKNRGCEKIFLEFDRGGDCERGEGKKGVDDGYFEKRIVESEMRERERLPRLRLAMTKGEMMGYAPLAVARDARRLAIPSLCSLRYDKGV